MPGRARVRRVRLTPRAHTVFRLGSNLLLIFKPRGHREEEHAHPHGQRLRVLQGRLVVRTARRSIVLRARRQTFTLAAGCPHATVAAEDTWVVAEAVLPRTKFPR